MDDTKVKRPLNRFFCFKKDNYHLIQNYILNKKYDKLIKFTNLSQNEICTLLKNKNLTANICTLLGKAWKNTSDDEKKIYKDKQDEILKVFKKNNPNYKYQPNNNLKKRKVSNKKKKLNNNLKKIKKVTNTVKSLNFDDIINEMYNRYIAYPYNLI